LPALLSLLLLVAAPAAAVDETDFCASGADPCEFNGAPLTIGADTTLDFGSRTVIIGNSKVINLAGGVRLTINAGTFKMAPGSQIKNGQVANGADVIIAADDDIIMEGPLGFHSHIEVPATLSAGLVQFTAGHDIRVDGDIRSDATGADGEGGTIDLDAGGSVTIAGRMDLAGGSLGSGGEFVVSADGPVVIGGPVEAPGGFDGGSIDLSSNASLSTTGTLDIRGTGAGSLGGNLVISAEGTITLGGKVTASGTGSLSEGGGSGGDIDISAGASIVLNETVDLAGGAPEGFGGIATFIADVDILQNRPMLALGAGDGAVGGDLSYLAGRIVSLDGASYVNGSDQGGDFAASAQGEVRANADIDASGEGPNGSGGTIQLDGLVVGVPQVSGNIVVTRSLIAKGNGTTVGGGGSIYLQGCNLTTDTFGWLVNFGDKCNNTLRASGQMTIAGRVQALPNGTNILEFLDPTKPPVRTGREPEPPAPFVRNASLPGCQPPVPPVCGDGDPTGVEGCDDGNLTSCDGCSGGSNGMTCHAEGCCQVEACGNGKKECGEECDDGNVVDGDGCDSNCTPTGCGNGRVTAGEECDDDNTTPGDGCDATCLIEPPPGCGNGMADDGEECDDGNNVSCDGCSKICVVEKCGNGRQECGEACDDGGTLACDGDCAADCSRKVGVCGDGVTECGEQCDAGAANGTPGSACSGFCRTCAIGSGTDCPCGTDFDCAPGGLCAGLQCVNGTCSPVDVPKCNDGNDCNGVESCVNGECTVPTPAACLDDDPCTDDTCNPVGGCPHPRKTGLPGISCRVDFIEALATNAAVADLPTKLRAKILKLAPGARSRLVAAGQETQVKRQKKLLKAAEKQLSKLVGVIKKGRKKKQISDALGGRLQEQAEGALGAAKSFRAGLTG
jgi:cysteine-rich repeat protein